MDMKVLRHTTADMMEKVLIFFENIPVHENGKYILTEDLNDRIESAKSVIKEFRELP